MYSLLKYAGFIPVAFLLFLSAPGLAAVEDNVSQIDRIVAVVDNNVITYSELQDRIRIVLGQLEKQGTARPPQDVLEKQVLERLIGDRLQLQLPHSAQKPALHHRQLGLGHLDAQFVGDVRG